MGNTLSNIPIADKILLMGGFNATVGTDNTTWNCLGRFGYGKMNSNGLNLLQLCTEHTLKALINATLFFATLIFANRDKNLKVFATLIFANA